MFSRYKKIGVVYGFLVILLIIAVGVRFWHANNLKNANNSSNVTSDSTTSPKNENKISRTGKISLIANSSSFKVGDKIDLSVEFEANGKKLDGADFVIVYDPNILSATGFSGGKSFNIFSRKDIDDKLGSVKVTALDSTTTEQFGSQKISIGVIHFLAKKAGTANVNFDFSAGSTNKTTLIEQITSQNILGEAEGITIKVTQ